MIISTLRIFFKNWIYVLLIAIVLGGTAFLYASWQDDKYVGSLTFVVDEASAAGGGIGSIVGRLGLGSLNPSGVNLDRVIEFSKSKFVTRKVLQDSVILGKDSLMIGNYLANYYKLQEKWVEADNKELLRFSEFAAQINLEDRVESKVFQTLHSGIHKGIYDEDPLVTVDYNASTGIFTVTANTLSEELSYSLSRSLYQNLRDVYTAQAREKDQIVYNTLSQKRDSLETRLNSITAAYNQELDRNSRVVLSRNQQQLKNYEKDILQTTAMLQEVMQNGELTQFRLLTITPAFKIIDAPFYPLRQTRTSPVRYLLAGIVLGVVLCVLYFLSIVVYREVKTITPKE